MAARAKKDTNLKIVNTFNQILKTFGAYHHSADYGTFYTSSDGIQFALTYDKDADPELAECELLKSDFTVPDGVALFDFFKDTKSLQIDGLSLIRDDGNNFQFHRPSAHFNEQTYRVLLGEYETEFEVDCSTADLYYADTMVKAKGFYIRDVLDTLKAMSALDGHSIVYMQLEEKRVTLYSSKIFLDVTRPFIMFDRHYLKDVKAKAKDTQHFTISLRNNKSMCEISYGTQAQAVHIGFNGIFIL